MKTTQTEGHFIKQLASDFQKCQGCEIQRKTKESFWIKEDTTANLTSLVLGSAKDRMK